MKVSLTLLLLSISLSIAAPSDDRLTTDTAPYKDVKDKDAAMDGAVTKARESLGFFLAALKAHKPDSTEFEVKKCFVDRDKVEHLWVRDITWDGKAFHGLLDNKPLEVGNTDLGRHVTVDPEDLTDWMFVKGGKLIGGFTIRVLYSRLSGDEKARFQKEADFTLQ